MWRKAGAIPSINGYRIPSSLVVFDTEAWRGPKVNGVELQTLRLGVAKHIVLDALHKPKSFAYYHFEDVSSLANWLEYLTRKDKCLYVYAHNLKYDLQLSGLLTWLIGLGWKTSLFVVSDPPTFIRLKRGRMSILFVDTFNYWQFSVSKMGDQLGLAKLPMPGESEDNEAWFKYCQRDVDVLSEYLLKFISWAVENDLAPLGLTIASQAFRSFRHRFMDHEIILHNNDPVTKLEREAYSGGRVEAYFIGQAPLQTYYKLDVNSMYPYVMLERLYPYELVGYAEKVSLETLQTNLLRYYCVASVKLRAVDNAYPFRLQHKLVFPVGSFISCLHSVDLNHALANQEIIEVNRLAIYNQADLFSPYVQYYYDQKLQAERDHNPIMRQQAKLFLNSLYGKFGQYEITSKYVPNQGDPSYQRVTGYSESLGKRVEVNYLGNIIQVSYPAGEAAYSFPAIAGAVTSYARSYLYKLIGKAGRKNVFYVDTDSLITNEEGYYNLRDCLNDTRLGSLKLEGQSDYLFIRGNKDYTFGQECKHKGIPRSAIQSGSNQWEYDEFRGAKTWLADGLPVGVEVYTKTKGRKTPYDKGIILQTGEVIPLSF